MLENKTKKYMPPLHATPELWRSVHKECARLSEELGVTVHKSNLLQTAWEFWMRYRQDVDPHGVMKKGLAKPESTLYNLGPRVLERLETAKRNLADVQILISRTEKAIDDSLTTTVASGRTDKTKTTQRPPRADREGTAKAGKHKKTA